MHYIVLIGTHFVLSMHISAAETKLAIARKFEVVANLGLLLLRNKGHFLQAMRKIARHALITRSLSEQSAYLNLRILFNP